MNKKQINSEEIPDSADAEKWLTPSIFLWHGRTWELKPNLQIVEITNPGAGVTPNASGSHPQLEKES